MAGALFRALWPPVRRLAGRLLPRPSDADDAAQDAMIRIFERALDYDRSRAGLPWAMAITGYACLTVRQRRARRREALVDVPPEREGGASPDDLLEQEELIEAAREALTALGDADREVLVETYWQERGAPASAMQRKRRQRALERVRTLFWRIYG